MGLPWISQLLKYQLSAGDVIFQSYTHLRIYNEMQWDKQGMFLIIFPLYKEILYLSIYMGFPGVSDTKESACNAADLSSIPQLGRSLGRAWQPTPVFLSGEFPQTEEPGRLQSMGSQRVGHDGSD